MPTSMPDVANQTQAQTEGTLDWVGMSNIEVPLMVAASDASERPVAAHVEAFVNLKDPKTKGIHMSRLYLLLDKMSTEGELSHASLKQLLQDFIDSHQDISNQAFIKFDFDYHLRRESLISRKKGWKAYPVSLTGRYDAGKMNLELSVDVPYSSTCPCSAALARQLIQEAFVEKFAEQEVVDKASIHEWLGSTEGIVATPHSQRSTAEVKVNLSEKVEEFPIVALIDAIEGALKTPVQAAVKREDEQEFARLNGQNLMFCEDASRRLKHQLNQMSVFKDFWLRVNHYESLHAHDAVAIATKGVEGGYNS